MQELPNAVERFLEGLRTGNWDGMEQHLTPDAVHDGSMPGWRLQYQGPARIAQEYRENWTAKGTWRLLDPVVTVAGDTVVVELHGTILIGPGEDLLCRIANVFQLRGDRIMEHRYYCCGEWDEATVRLIDTEAPTVGRREVPA